MIELVGSHKTDDDYIVTLLRPDGVEIRVAIPDETSGYYNTCVVRAKGTPFYLNMVTYDHYT